MMELKNIALLFSLKVIPEGQALRGEEYKGAVKFYFWRFGTWITVYVDDRLPTVNGKLMHSRSSNDDEFWVSLIEKAYAKCVFLQLNVCSLGAANFTWCKNGHV